MKLSIREIELNKAREQGVRDFENNNSYKNDFSDVGLRAAYAAGWEQARKDYHSFYGCGFD